MKLLRPLRLLFGLGIATFLLLGPISSAHAQYRAAPPPRYYAPAPYGYPPPQQPQNGIYRGGLVLGFGLGGGGITGNCGIGFCGGALSGEFHIGGMMTPRLAILFDLWGNVRDVDNTNISFSQTFWTVAGQYWVLDILWLKAGLGASHVQLSDYYGPYQDDTALGLVLAGGVEVVQFGNMALDLQGRVGFGFYDPNLTNYALLVGLNWY